MRLFRLLAVLIALAGLALVTRPYIHGFSFVIRAADMGGTARRVADLDSRPVRERDVAIPGASGSIRGRVYEAEGGSSRAALLVAGLHASGIDEPRLTRIARLLASHGVAVVTPDIPQLSEFDISPALTDHIERAAEWLATQSGLAADRKIGLFGISFSGGLALVAAGRPSIAARVSHVLAFGGHDDLPRVLRYLCTGQEPYPTGQARVALDGSRAQPFTSMPDHRGVAVILLGVADRVVPPAQVADLRLAVRQYLRATARDGSLDKSQVPDESEALKARIGKLPEPSRTLMRYVADRDVVHLGARLLPHINGYASSPALSVSKSPKPGSPVFLLHDVDDKVIPSVESEYLAEDIRGQAPVRLLLSGLLSRPDAGAPVAFARVLEQAGFWADLLQR